MPTTLSHCGDTAVLAFTGDLTLEAVVDLIESADAAVRTYFYPRIEIRLSSPGGLVQALELFAAALARWRACGVTVNTRVPASVGSAAAILFSLGDQRICDPHATLFYHQTRLSRQLPIDASDAARLYGMLAQADEQVLGLLVDRALSGRSVPVVAPPDDDDEPALERFASYLPRDVSLPEGDERPSATLAAIASHVAAVVKNADREALEQIYRSVLAASPAMSGALACAFHLADCVGEPDALPVASAQDPMALTIPEWSPLFPPHGAVPRSILTRHFMILGETGAGKTLSGVLPLVAALARTPPEAFSGALLVDPKGELAPIVAALAADRLRHLNDQDLVIDLMAGPRWTVTADLSAKRWISASQKILLRVASLVPSSSLRVLGPHQVDTSNAEFFDREGTSMLRDLLAFVLMLLDAGAPPLSDWLPGDDEDSTEPEDHSEGRAWVEALHARAVGRHGERGPNILSQAAWALGTPLVQATDGPRWLWSEVAAAAMPVWGAEPGEGRDLIERICGYWRRSADVDRQHMGVVASARGPCHEFADPLIAHTIFFGCETGCDRTLCPAVEFANLVSCERPLGQFVVYQPGRHVDLVVAALKAQFFEAVFDDPVRRTASSTIPLAAYICDEAHRFLTSDPVHGQQSFLDSCRSYGVCVAMAAQGVASFEHALVSRGGSREEREYAISILLNTTGTKLVFRTTDPATLYRLDSLCPVTPGLTSLVRARPPCTLRPGECYAILSDARFERRQLAPASVPLSSPGPARKRSRKGSGAQGVVKAGKPRTRQEVSS